MAASSNSPTAPLPGTSYASLDSLMIERATSAHVPYLRRLKETVMEGRYRPTPDPESFERWRGIFCTDEYFDELLAKPETLLLCLGTLRDPVGMVVIQRHADHVEIDDLLVLHERSGDGTRLLVSCIAYAEAWRIPRLTIDVYSGNEPTELFLSRHRFVRTVDTESELGFPMHTFERTVSV